MSKQQTGFRVDRVLFKQFQELCKQEKLRPGEAVESLMRSAVGSGSVANFSLNATRSNTHSQQIDRMLFKSKMSRMKRLIDRERADMKTKSSMEYFEVDGELVDYEKELIEIARASRDEQLVPELQEILGQMDAFHAEIKKAQLEELKEEWDEISLRCLVLSEV